jgi:hypothetical protein
VVALLLVIPALVISTGCVPKGKFNSVQNERDALAQQQDSLSKANAELAQERDELALMSQKLTPLWADSWRSA